MTHGGIRLPEPFDWDSLQIICDRWATIPQEIADAVAAETARCVEWFHDPDDVYAGDPTVRAIPDGEVRERVAGWQCVVPGTRVLRADLRWVPIERLEVGDRVISFDEFPQTGHRRHWRVGTVLGKKILVRKSQTLRLSDGTELTSALDHPWFIGGTRELRWCDTRWLNYRKSQQSKMKRLLPVWDEDESYDGGWLAGFLDGEGSLRNGNGNGSLQVWGYQNSGAVFDKAVGVMRELGFRPTVHRRSDRTGMAVSLSRTTDCLRLLGQVRPVRLLDKVDLRGLGCIQSHDREYVRVEEKGAAHDEEVVALMVDARTYLAEGFGAHNSEYDKEVARHNKGKAEDMKLLRYVLADMPFERQRALVERWERIWRDWTDAHPEWIYESDCGFIHKQYGHVGGPDGLLYLSRMRGPVEEDDIDYGIA